MTNRSKKMGWMMLALLIAAAAAGCSARDAAPGDSDPAEEELRYVVIDPQSSEFAALYQGDFKEWYDSSIGVDGLHSFIKEGRRYLLVSAGERPSGGYFLEELALAGTEEEIVVTVLMREPSPGEQVTDEITYPHLLVHIPDDGRQLVYGGLGRIERNHEEPPKDNDAPGGTQPPDENAVEHTESGRLIGWIDNNSIEIQISGVPDQVAPRVFRLSADAREKLQQQDIQDGEVVLFNYKIEGETQTITKIMRLEN